ncbi:MAG: nuclear transport factor 2 family protein [Reyranella sp.]|uniref:nuclear transport factor 2 family protein n=1 Tax=Reyranella sp. TaxID=1929291 RepID=UPI001ACF1C15|nr:nuclear transport factor 2 family protein [Reyranella sp.]MBN9086014.1 nuclear transport factor 2 family protein [Reyranella sp.]
MIVEEIRALLAAKSDALVRRSAADITALLHPNFLLVTAGGKTIGKADYIDVGITGTLVYHGQKIRELEVRVFDDAAVASMLVDDWFTIDGREIIQTYRNLSVFTRLDGRWVWAANQAMLPTAS